MGPSLPLVWTAAVLLLCGGWPMTAGAPSLASTVTASASMLPRPDDGAFPRGGAGVGMPLAMAMRLRGGGSHAAAGGGCGTVRDCAVDEMGAAEFRGEGFGGQAPLGDTPAVGGASGDHMRLRGGSGASEAFFRTASPPPSPLSSIRGGSGAADAFFGGASHLKEIIAGHTAEREREGIVRVDSAAAAMSNNSILAELTAGLETYLDRALAAPSVTIQADEGEELSNRRAILEHRYALLLENCKLLQNTAADATARKKIDKRVSEMEEAGRTLRTLPIEMPYDEWTQEDKYKVESVEYCLDSVEFALGSQLPRQRDYPCVWVTFVLECNNTKLGDKVLVTGEAPELGSWEIKNASQLTTDRHTYPKWNVTVPLKAGALINYKYCIGKPSETPGVYSDLEWEGHMGNREVKVHRNIKRPQILQDFFIRPEEHMGNVADSMSPRFVHMHGSVYQDPEYVVFD